MRKYMVCYLFATLYIECESYAAAYAWHEDNHPGWELLGIHEEGDKLAFV